MWSRPHYVAAGIVGQGRCRLAPPTTGGKNKKRALAGLAVCMLGACATQQTKEQSLVDRAIDAMGGADRLAALNTVSVKGTGKQWEPEQSDMPGGEMRFANETSFELVQDRSQRASRTDFERRFAYPAPRTFKFSEVVFGDSGYVLGIDTNGRNAQSLKMNPPAHAMSGVRLATVQREALRGTVSRLLSEMRANPKELRPASDLVAAGASY